MIWWIAQTACVCALLAAVVTLVGRAARLSPAVKHALWLLVLLKLVTPPLAFYRLPVAAEKVMAEGTAWLMRPPGRAGQVVDADAVGTLSDADLLLTDPSGAGGEFRDDAALSTRADLTEIAGGSSSPAILEDLPSVVADTQLPPAADGDLALVQPDTRLAWLLAAVWLLGAVPLAVVQSLRVIRLRRLLTPSTPVPAWLDLLVRQVAAQLNIRPPRIVVVPAFCSPLICALGRPRLLWPAGLSDQLPDDARRAVLLHELAHLRRRDHWVAWLELAAGVLWWFNPLYWYVRHQLRENAELACDAWVVGLLPSGRRAYAQALIEVTEFVSYAPAAMPAVAMGNVARRTLERRLTMIMRERTSYRVPLFGAGLIGLSLLAILPGFSGGQDSVPLLESRSSQNGTSIPTIGVGNVALPEKPATGNVPLLPGLATYSADVAPGPEVADKEQRIQHLEAQLNQLQAAVQALRTANPLVTADQRPSEMQKPASSQAADSFIRSSLLVAQNHYAQGRPAYDIETLTRARYKLPGPMANALASFIEQYVKNDVEARVTGETLTVIASQEDQAKIGAFIELLRKETDADMQGKPQSAGNGAPLGIPRGQEPASDVFFAPARR